MKTAQSSNRASFFTNLLWVAVIACCFPGEAAQTAPLDAPQSFRKLERIWKLDRNNDSQISRAEFERWRGSKRRPQLFEQIDTDGNGLLTKEEIDGRAGPAAQTAPLDAPQSSRKLERIWKLDRNNDSQISRAEFERSRGSKRRPQLFEQIDTDGNGLLTKEEIDGRAGPAAQAPAVAKQSTDCVESGECGAVHRDIPYKTIGGVDPNLLSLDVYETTWDNAPVMVWVHGGGWTGGDKATKNGLGYKPSYFTGKGFLFISVNYRLSPKSKGSPDPGRLMYPVHNQDVAAAIGWIKTHARDFGGNPDNISLIGHSAGGGIVTQLATDESFLAKEGVALDNLRCVITLDIGGAYDLTQSAPGGRLFQHVFGQDPKVWEQASPIRHVESGKDIPAFFIVSGKDGDKDRGWRLSGEFAEKLKRAGIMTELFITEGMEHKAINQAIGDPKDTRIMPRLERFLEHCQGGHATVQRDKTARENPEGALFSLAYRHEQPTAQATALVDAFGNSTLDLAIAAKGHVYLVRNKGAFAFSHHATLRVDRANGWGLHDFNRDGRMDLFVAQPGVRGKDSWINQGDGTFIARDLGNETKGPTRNVLFADFDGDGNIDSYHSVSSFQRYHTGCELHPGKSDGTFGPDIIETILDPAVPDFWYATADPPGRGKEKWSNKMMKGAVVRDFDGDGRPDIITGAYADRGYQEGGRGGYGMQWVEKQDRGLFVLHNRSTPGRIRFAEVAKSAVGRYAYGNSMGDWNVYSVVPIDYDRDGDFDLFVGATVRPAGKGRLEDTVAARFFENRSEPGRIRFVDRTKEAGFSYLNAPPPAVRAERRLAAGQAFDYDNDGWPDLVMANRQNPEKTRYPFAHLYRNRGNGTFEEVPYAQHGLGGGSGGRDLVCGDLDDDGRIDVVLNSGTVGGFQGTDDTSVYRNQSVNSNHWIRLDLVENVEGTPAIGTKVRIYRPGSTDLVGFDEVRTDFSYRSKRSPVLHFGVGTLDAVDVRVTTREGKQRVFKSVAVARTHRLPL
ncbi:MAG: FG-GAP-like repeat-containing protein [Pseudomonadota bacterium]|nr:FG-GAP-like repeat-containing protein [Pseudomonadota bacterium]